MVLLLRATKMKMCEGKPKVDASERRSLNVFGQMISPSFAAAGNEICEGGGQRLRL